MDWWRITGKIDWFILGLLVVLSIGILVPLPHESVQTLSFVARRAVMLLFLVYGARLRTSEVLSGLKNWRLQGAMLGATFVAFPLLGLLNQVAAGPFLGATLTMGITYVCLLPSTVNSSIAFTSIAGGNVAAAIAGATASNIAGVIITPLLVAAEMGRSGGFQVSTLVDVVVLILLPFALGQLLQPWVGDFLRSHKWLTTLIDRGTVLLSVLAASSMATDRGLWEMLEGHALALLVADSLVILALMLAFNWTLGGWLKLARPDRIALLMVGSKKALSSGVPMAMIIFPPALAGVVTVPLILFHLLQLLACSVIARRLARA